MKEFLADSLTACFAMAGVKVELSGGYSGWQPNVDSPILHAMKLSYKQQFGVEPCKSNPCRFGMWYYWCQLSGIGYDFLRTYTAFSAFTG